MTTIVTNNRKYWNLGRRIEDCTLTLRVLSDASKTIQTQISSLMHCSQLDLGRGQEGTERGKQIIQSLTTSLQLIQVQFEAESKHFFELEKELAEAQKESRKLTPPEEGTSEEPPLNPQK